ncbi:AGAP004917-PA-like protein [Anopheles sinensis]|uniref:AGAP004917-PA-like protein n=1 Tax=Anopheles sinensis TaxID=74873 RepID=A0A084W6I8_ANOSI|nr:AGAP004917-PA-like protein [Anopheles sinensis]
MNKISVFFMLTFGVLMPSQYRCDNVQTNNDIGGLQFELLLTHLADLNSLLERLEAKVDALESRMENLIKSSTSEIITEINQNEAKVDGFESRAEDRYENSSLIAERLEKKVDIVIMNQSPLSHLNTFVRNLNISTLRNPWTTIQHRFNGSIDFFRNWNAYKNGFGQQRGEFWIGLEKLYQMTRSEKHELLIVLEDFNGTIKYALYDDFKIGSEDENYVLKKLGEYSGTAGVSFNYHVGTQFSTYDRDNDERPNQNCAKELQGGWWFRSGSDCISCNLNGKYYQQPEVQKMQGLNWYSWRGDYYSLKSTKMMIRRRSMTAG